jgi:hypothetical protein
MIIPRRPLPIFVLEDNTSKLLLCMNTKYFYIKCHNIISDANPEKNMEYQHSQKLESKEYQKQIIEQTLTVFPRPKW